MSEGQVELGMMDEVVRRAKSGLSKTKELEKTLSEQEKEDMRISNMLERAEKQDRDRDIRLRYRREREKGIRPQMAEFIARGRLEPYTVKPQNTLSDKELENLSKRVSQKEEEDRLRFALQYEQESFAGGPPKKRSFEEKIVGAIEDPKKFAKESFKSVADGARDLVGSFGAVKIAAGALGTALAAGAAAIGAKEKEREGVERMANVDMIVARASRRLGVSKEYLRRVAGESKEGLSAIESITTTAQKQGGFMGGQQVIQALEGARRGDISWSTATEWASTGQGIRAMRERRDDYMDPASLVNVRRRQEEYAKYQAARGTSTIERINDVYTTGARMYEKGVDNPFLTSLPGVDQSMYLWNAVGVSRGVDLNTVPNSRPEGRGITTFSREVRQPGFDVTGRNNQVIINMPTGLSPRSGNRSGDR